MAQAIASRNSLVRLSWLIGLTCVLVRTDATGGEVAHASSGTAPTLPGTAQLLPANVSKPMGGNLQPSLPKVTAAASIPESHGTGLAKPGAACAIPSSTALPGVVAHGSAGDTAAVPGASQPLPVIVIKPMGGNVQPSLPKITATVSIPEGHGTGMAKPGATCAVPSTTALPGVAAHGCAGGTATVPEVTHSPSANGNKPAGRNLEANPSEVATAGSAHREKSTAAAKPGVASAVHPSTAVKAASKLGETDALVAAPVSSFGFLPAKTAATSALPTTSVAASVKPAVPAPSVSASAAATLRAAPLTSSVPPALPTPVVSTPAVPISPVVPVPAPAAARAFFQAAALPAPANVVLDASLGQSRQPKRGANVNGGDDYAVDASLGHLSGNNLFFSFLQFNLAANESATFTGPASVQNILARVTDGFASNIDGAINVSIDGANLLLMNPAGIVFTAGASINLTGSFATTTADYLKFADGKRFTALPGSDDVLLSTAAVSAFGFLAGQPAPVSPVTFTGSSLATAQGANFLVIAGDQTIDGASLLAPAGHFNLVSVAGPGEVPAVPSVLADTPLTALPALGTVNIQNVATVSAATFGTSQPGHVEIVAGAVNVLNSSTIDASMLEVPDGEATNVSSILIRSQSLLLSDARSLPEQMGSAGMNPSLIVITASGQVAGGSITLTANTLSIMGSSIKTSANGSGEAGNIKVTADNLLIVGSSNFLASGILAESGFAGLAGQTFTGRSGDVNVVAQQLSLTDGGQISATTFGPGQGGNVSVSAHSLTISGFNTSDNQGIPIVFQSGILASSELPGNQGAGGAGGNVTISTNSLDVSNHGLISASTAGSGSGGSVSITADSILLNGSGAALPTRIAATTSYQTGGKGGDISIATGALQVLGGAEISAATLGGGAGGNISISGGSVTVSEVGSIITAQTLAPKGGTGGDLRLNVNSVSVLEGGQISAATQGSGRGGSIEITANRVTVDGSSAAIRADTSGLDGIVSTDPFVDNLSLTLSIAAAADSTLRSFLVNPADNNIVLFNRSDAAGADFFNTTFNDSGVIPISGGVAPYAGTFQPATALALLNGGAANGIWQLQIGNSGQLSATLESWSLTVNGTPFTSSDVPQTIRPRSLLSFPVTVTLPTIQTQVQAGVGGSIRLNAGSVTLRNGGTVSASTFGDGAAGSLNIQANSVTIDATQAAADTGFFASTAAGSAGRGGSITLAAKEFQVSGNPKSGIVGGVVARSVTDAAAGDIRVESRNVILDNHAVVSSANLGGGPAGSVSLKAGNSIVLQNGGLVTTLSQAANAGNISLIAGRNVELHNNSIINASAGASGGNIVIRAGKLFYLDHSEVIATAGTGAGGNITIDPIFIILDQGLISANAAAGAGGNILIEGQYFFDNESPITATGTTAGTVQITTLPLDLVNALAGLQSGFIDVSAALQDRCAMRLGTDFSSFLLLGRGGVEESPEEPQSKKSVRFRPKAKGKVPAR